ncbi:MAG: hypothetical protein NZ805_07585 [Armatimonadetes bacterium]|nr:hypothetical protein [Armatimonadota bacterium]MDW8029276.1 hypothetical protein [Armatimonadota bacterium]
MDFLPLFALGAILVETGLGRAKGALHCFVKGLIALAVGTTFGFLGQDWGNAILCGVVALLATLGLGDRITLLASAFIAASVSIFHKLLLIFDRLVGLSTNTPLPEWLFAFKPVLDWLSVHWQPDYAFLFSVHTLAGGSALGALLASGPRIGRYSRTGSLTALPAHNLPIAAIGAFLIWLGSQGFSQTLWESSVLCGFIALLTSIAWTKWRFGKVDPSFAITSLWTGLVGGLALGKVAFLPAFLVGVFSGVISVSVSLFLDKNFIDDPVGIVPAEGFAPLIGLTVFWFSNGTTFGSGLFNWVLAFALGFGGTWLVCRILAFFNLLRLHPMDELEGADLHLYGIAAYPEFETREA